MVVSLILTFASFGIAQNAPALEADIVLRGAMLFDGSGTPGVLGDVAIKGDRIVAVGKVQVKGSPRVIDCTGLILAPGFIDLHTHSDYPLQDRVTSSNLNYLKQGVTTVVTGNCGAGPVDVAKYFKTLEQQGVGTNVIHQVPHNAVRSKVMGNQNRDPTPDELDRMIGLVDQGMRDGAWGLATGLIYTPGTYAKTDELVALAKAAAKHGGLYASHIRDEAAEVFVAMEEILAIARRAGIRVHISHIKVTGQRQWGKATDVIALLRKARKDGIEVTADQYPYVASSTSLAAMVVPTKYREGTPKDFFARLDDLILGPMVRRGIESRIEGRSGGNTLRIARFSPRPDWQGKDLATIADQEKKPLLDIVLEIERQGGAQIVSFGMNEEDVRLFMKETYVATASDGTAMVPGKSVPHPRSYGTFARKIGRYAIEDEIISLEHAIRSATGLPAEILQLPNRGTLNVGAFADIVVFDPKTFRDRATYDAPHQYATGVRYLFINGRMVIEEGRFTNTLAGRVLRHETRK